MSTRLDMLVTTPVPFWQWKIPHKRMINGDKAASNGLSSFSRDNQECRQMSIGDRQIPLDRRITLAEAARLSGKSERTLRRWYHQGKLQAMQEGGINSLLYFDIQQIAALAGSTAILQRLDLIEARLASL